MSKPKLIIVEGPQGVGKTTLTNLLREKIPYSNLYRLSGHNDGSQSGLKKSADMYESLMRYIEELGRSGCGMNLIFDRTFITEHVYCELGFREYKFSPAFDGLMRWLDDLSSLYDVYIFQLAMDDIRIYEERLARDKPKHLNVSFDVNGSIKQQFKYGVVLDAARKRCKNIKMYRIPAHVGIDKVLEGVLMLLDS